MAIPITYYLAVSCALFAIGAIGVLIRRNAIIIFMCIEMMLNAVNLALIAFSDYHKSIDGQMLVFFVMVVAAAEVAVGLALIYVIFRNKGTVYVDELNIMKW
jgi:NADH-quinone oxidoreductase subunit K